MTISDITIGKLYSATQADGHPVFVGTADLTDGPVVMLRDSLGYAACFRIERVRAVMEVESEA